MGRPHVEFIQAADVAVELVAQGPLAGARQRLLSRDESDGAYTVLLSLSPAWSSAGGTERPFELFCIRGDLRVGGRAAPAGHYAYVPGRSASRTLATERGALAIVFFGAEREEDGEIEIVDSDSMRWALSGIVGEADAGITVKKLHMNAATGDGIFLAGIVPGWFLSEAETHPVAQEVFMLQGDVLLPGRGSFTSGCYFWRPPLGLHGPLISRAGALILLRSFAGDFTVDWYPAPEWEELHKQYLAERPLLADID